jgi:hypothetical protein
VKALDIRRSSCDNEDVTEGMPTMKTATQAQIRLYTRLVGEIVELNPAFAEFAPVAVEAFPNRTVADASNSIDRAMHTLKGLKAAAPAPAADPAPVTFHVHPGVYTVVTPNGRRTFKVERQASDAEFAPGKVVISFLNGPDNDSDYKGFGFLDGATVRPWKRYADATELLAFTAALLADPDAALVAKHCARCGRTLTTPQSISDGLGPECIKVGLK